MSGYTKLKLVSLKSHPNYNEVWLQNLIASDPEILGLGSLVVKDRERTHRGGGRLDMLLQDEDGIGRYEIEIQLGASDESHIIRTIEYWDHERKLYPQYEHTAVLIAEDITSRFLNVVSLFNGHIPIMALQLTAVETPEGVGILFTRVLDTVKLGLVDEDETVSDITDRTYWEKTKTSPAMLALADQIYEICRSFAPNLIQSYKKNYIGFRLNNQPFNFAVCKPHTHSMWLEISLPQSEDLDSEIAAKGLELLAYNRHFGKYKISLKAADIQNHRDYLKTLLKKAYDSRL
jgi:hypothetical protein